MFRVASILIVMALATSPTAKVVCDVTCLAESIPISSAPAGCHGAQQQGGPALKAVPDPCERVAAVGLFIPQGTYKVVRIGSGSILVAAVTESLRDLRRGDGACLLRVDSGPPPLGRTLTVLRI